MVWETEYWIRWPKYSNDDFSRPNVYVDVLEKWFAEFRIKGLPNFIRDTMLEASYFEYIALNGLTGEPVIPSSFLFNQFKCVRSYSRNDYPYDKESNANTPQSKSQYNW